MNPESPVAILGFWTVYIAPAHRPSPQDNEDPKWNQSPTADTEWMPVGKQHLFTTPELRSPSCCPPFLFLWTLTSPCPISDLSKRKTQSSTFCLSNCLGMWEAQKVQELASKPHMSWIPGIHVAGEKQFLKVVIWTPCVYSGPHMCTHTQINKIKLKKKLSLILSLQFTVSSTGDASLLFKHSRLTPGTEALHQLLPRPHSLVFVPSSPSTKRFSFQPLLRAQPSSSYAKGEYISWLQQHLTSIKYAINTCRIVA